MDTQQLIKERYSELPPDIQKAITSTDLASKFADIAAKHGLHIDQNGSLQTETLLVMLGLEDTDDYVGNLKRELDVSTAEASAIAQDVNTSILDAIKNSLRKIQEEDEAEEVSPVITQPTFVPKAIPRTIDTSLEKAGDFTIIKRPPSNSPIHNDSNLKREDVLHDLENIEKLKPSNANNFVEHLLANPVSNPPKINPGASAAPTQKIPAKPIPPAKPAAPGVDPYREQI